MATIFTLRMLPSIALGLALAPTASTAPQTPTGQSPELRVYNSLFELESHMVDTNNVIVHTWTSTKQAGGATQVTEDGTLLRATRTVTGDPGSFIPGTTGGIQRLDFDGNVLWDYEFTDPAFISHHEFEPMPNGNILMLVWEEFTAADAIANGRDPALLDGPVFVPDTIVELQPNGPTGATVVWEWHFWDHLIQDFDDTKANYGVVADNPQLLDINYPPVVLSNGDFTHFNSIGYSPENDWIVVSSREQSEFYIIDHSTTTAEAAGHTGGLRGKGGDLLYRWGNKAAYQKGTEADQQLFQQHTAYFIDPGYPGEGNVLLFSNNHPGPYSSIVEVDLPIDGSGSFILEPDGTFGPADPFWEWTAPVPTDFHSLLASSARRAKNGNTLVNSTLQGWFFEVDSNGQIVWEWLNGLTAQPDWVFQVKYVDRSLWTDADSISLSAGGSVDLDLLTGSSQAGRVYLTLGSVTGTEPGIPYGLEVLPLNLDAYLNYTLAKPNSAILQNSLGILDANGATTTTFALPPGVNPALAGTTVYHASVVLEPIMSDIVHISNAVATELVP